MYYDRGCTAQGDPQVNFESGYVTTFNNGNAFYEGCKADGCNNGADLADLDSSATYATISFFLASLFMLQ